MGKSASDIEIESTKSRLDALDSHKQDDSIPSPLCVVGTANDKSQPESPVFRLPTELTMLIFRECGSDIRRLLTLTHICQRWRQIAVNDASIWTNISINTVSTNANPRLDNFLFFLGMQLDRTANILLDVEWIADMRDRFFVPTLQLIRRKAPFNSWRTLKLYISDGLSQSSPWNTASDAFTNLESLFVWDGTESTILHVIDSTITSRLNVLDLTTWPGSWHANMMRSFPRSFTYISSLFLDSLPSALDTPFLPANVLNLQIDRAQEHPFPHIRTYTLTECTFVGGNTDNLANMTTLVISGPLMITRQVFFPALRQLTVRTIWIDESGRIEAPVLDDLYFMDGVRTGSALIPRMDKALQCLGYTLSPNNSVIADSYLPSTILLNVLSKSPKMTHATLRFDDWVEAQELLEELLWSRTETESSAAEDERLCPRLSELRLDFGWKLAASSISKEWLVDGLKARRDTGIMPAMSIYVGWKGEGTYVLLPGE